MPHQGVRLQVPFFPQEDYHCGPATLASLLNYNGLQTDPLQLARQVYIPGRKGSLQVEMTAAIRSYERVAYPLPAGNQREMAQLIGALDASYPVLVLQNLGIEWLPQWHYATVTGYNLATAELILNSGTHEDYRMSISTFEHTWKRSNYWALVVGPATDIPPFATHAIWNQAAFDLESSGHIDAAFTAYQAALQRWPNNKVALLGKGNTAYALQRYSIAADSFYQFARFHSAQAATGWNNLAHALSALHCPKAARSAVLLALALSPEDRAIRSSADEMAATPENPNTSAPPASSNQCSHWQARMAQHS